MAVVVSTGVSHMCDNSTVSDIHGGQSVWFNVGVKGVSD